MGLRPKLTAIVQPVAQFLAAFPNNLLFPLVVSLIVFWNANPDIWLSPLIVLGTQWYILFNVIAGASTMPQELRDAAENFGVHGWLWWRRSPCPRCFPFMSPAPSPPRAAPGTPASLAEVASWGKTHAARPWPGRLYRRRHRRRAISTMWCWAPSVMSFFVVVVNRLLWRPLYWYAERKFRLT